MLTNKHFTPVVGLDIHVIVTPTGPITIPHPFIGMVIDVMDYIPFIGSSVTINHVPRGICDTSGMLITFKHIPMGGSFLWPSIIGHDSMNFFGSVNVKAESVSLSPAGFMLMTCNDIGIPLSLSPGKKMKPIPSLYLPTSFTIPIPFGKPVFVGGPYAPDLLGILKQLAMSYGFGALMKGGRKGIKKLKKLIPTHKFTKGLKKQLCKMGFEPVDLITGRVIYEVTDFEIPGVIPISWERNWYSDSSYEGPLGHGMHHKYDLNLQADPGRSAMILILGDGRLVAFPYMIAEGDDFYMREEKLTLKCIDRNQYEVIDHTERLNYIFELAQEYTYKLVRLKNDAGFTIQLEYDRNYNLVKMIDTAGRILNFDLDEQKHIISIKARHRNEERLLVTYQYNEAGDLIAIGDALGQTTTIHYQNHLMQTKTDRNGHRFYWEYDGNETGSRCMHTWGDDGLLQGWISYKDGYNEVTDSLNETSVYYFDENKLCTQIKDPLGNSTFHEYTVFMEPYRDIDEEGNVTGYTYDDRGNLKTESLPNGAMITYLYDDKDRLLLTVHPGGSTEMKTYDESGLLLSIISEDERLTGFEYNAHNLIGKLRNNNGNITCFFYDDDHNLTRVILPGEIKKEWKFDAWGRCIEMKNTEQHMQVFNYDELDRVTKIFLPDNNFLKLEYDAYNHVTCLQDREHHKIQLTYTPIGDLKSLEENGSTFFFKYDNEGRIIQLVNERGEIYHVVRNAKGDIIKEEGFDGVQRRHDLDRTGKIIRTERPGNKFSEYEYHLSGQLSRIQYDDGSWEMYNYDLNGELTEAVNETNGVQIIRDKTGNKEIQDGIIVHSVYGPMGFKEGITTSLGADITIENNELGFAKQMTVVQANMFWEMSTHYNRLGQELERTMGGVHVKTDYDHAGRIKLHQVRNKTNLKCNKHYEWGMNNKLYKINDLSNHSSICFDYDRFDNLIQSVTGTSKIENFFRDDAGNIFKTKERKDRMYAAGGKLMKSNNTAYEYDEEGNLIHKNSPEGEWFYEWKSNGLLKKVIRPDKKEVVFEYDALGRRTAKIFNNTITRWAWNEDVPVHEWKYPLDKRPHIVKDENGFSYNDQEEPTDNLITWIFDERTFKPVAKLFNDNIYSVTTNHNGTPCEAYNENGEKHWECELNISGEVIKHTGERCFVPFRFQGQYEDEETNLYYNRFRYYAPEDGVFISQDPIGLIGGDKLYAYVHDSNAWVDVLGLCPKLKGGHKLFGEIMRAGKSIFGKEYKSGKGRGTGKMKPQEAFESHTEAKFLKDITKVARKGDHVNMLGILDPCIPSCQPLIRLFVWKSKVTAFYKASSTNKMFFWFKAKSKIYQLEKVGNEELKITEYKRKGNKSFKKICK